MNNKISRQSYQIHKLDQHKTLVPIYLMLGFGPYDSLEGGGGGGSSDRLADVLTLLKDRLLLISTPKYLELATVSRTLPDTGLGQFYTLLHV